MKRRILFTVGAAALGLSIVWGATGGVPLHTVGQSPAATPTLAGQIAALSEPPGYFDTDNLISNERSYLDVIPALKARGVSGGAYVGVGPDQNFSYIAAIRPEVAFIVDVRRDNLLLHLLFKALFALTRNRVEYLAMLTGRPAPADVDTWRTATIERIVAHVEASAVDTRGIAVVRAKADEAISRIGVPLSLEDRATIDRFHRRFIEAGLGLRFESTGRAPQSHYPTYRDLLLGTDEGGDKGNYLASEDSFQFVKKLQERDLVIPVVGDLSGPRALVGIGNALRQRGLKLSALYSSNVEFYLFGDGRFDRFANNVAGMPRAGNGVIIRSVFGRYSMGSRGSSQHLQPLDHLVTGFAKGRFRYYGELVGDGR
jgi:hypothetical protein